MQQVLAGTEHWAILRRLTSRPKRKRRLVGIDDLENAHPAVGHHVVVRYNRGFKRKACVTLLPKEKSHRLRERITHPLVMIADAASPAQFAACRRRCGR
jgi:hypothetical protein